MLFESSKRKNDASANRWRPLLLISVILIGCLLVYALTRRSQTLYPDAPLVYVQASGERYAINLQTGERFPTNSSGIYTGDPSLLPGGKWRVSSWAFEKPESYEPLVPVALSSVQNPGLYLDTGRIGWIYSVSWSSDGQWIVFASPRPNCFSGSKEGLQTDLPATSRPKSDYCMEYPTYSEDTEWWLFNLQTGKGMAVPAEASEGEDVKENLGNTRGPRALFSPRQPQLFHTTRQGFYVYDVETGQQQLLFPGTNIYTAEWSPDAQWIAFTTGPDEYKAQLYIVRADGTGLQQIATDIRAHEIHWAP